MGGACAVGGRVGVHALRAGVVCGHVLGVGEASVVVC